MAPNVSDYGRSYGLFIHILSRSRPADAPAVFLASVLSYRGVSAGGTAREEFSHPLRELLHVLPIQILSPDGFPISAPLSDFTVGQALLFGFFQPLFFDQHSLPFKPFPHDAPS